MDDRQQHGDPTLSARRQQGMSLEESSHPYPDQPLGERLRHLRERQGLPLEAVARTLKIPERALRALEEGTDADLPADVYARGFVRLYAEYLGLDPVVAVREFAAARGRAGVPGAPVRLGPLPLRGDRLTRFLPRSRGAALALGAVLAVAALVYLFVEVRGFTRPPFLDVTDPPSNVEIRGTTLGIRGKTDPTADVRINGERTYVKSDGSFEETVGVSEGVNAIHITATSVGGKEQTVTREILVRRVEPTPASPAPGPSVSPGASQPADVMAIAVQAEGEPVWISLRADGAVVFSGLLLPGSRQEAQGKEVEVTSGKGVRTRVFVNGEDRGVLAETPGVVRDVVFTPGDIPTLPMPNRP